MATTGSTAVPSADGLSWPELAKSPPDWVVGHLNPDLDSLVSALVAAHLTGSQAARWETVEPLSEAVWTRLGQAVLPALGQEGTVGLVDCSLPQQPRSVLWAVDHHPQGQRLRPYPVYVEQVGATATIIARVRDRLTDMDRRLLAAAILADTMALTSNRTTDHDRLALSELVPDWRELVTVVFPPDPGLSPAQWRAAGRKQVLGLPWASGGGFGPAPDVDAIAEGEAGPFAFSWIDIQAKTTTLALVLDHRVVRRLTYPAVLSRTRIGPEIREPMEETFGHPLRYESESKE
ncbi:MAG: hypothetical protein ACYCOS_07025 [Sulfobacillus sp.]